MVVAYVVCALLVFTVYHLLSDGDFSFYLTLGGMTRTFGFGLLAFRVFKEKSAMGISLKTLQLYAIVFAARLSSILFFEGYLPYDSSGDWFYQANEIFALGLVFLNIWLVGVKFRATYAEALDAFGNLRVPPKFGALVYLAGPAFVVAAIFHPNLNSFWLSDVAWTFALYLESVAVVPQLYLFQRKGGEIETFTAHYVFTFGLSRFFLFIFWVSSAHELNDKTSQSIHGGWVGTVVLLMQVIHLVLMGDYSFYYIKSLKSGGPLVLPGINTV